jgi:hypothetical protein
MKGLALIYHLNASHSASRRPYDAHRRAGGWSHNKKNPHSHAYYRDDKSSQTA